MKLERFLPVAVLFLALAAGSAQGQTQRQAPPPPPPNGGGAPGFRIAKLAMAITNVDAMVTFYRNVFGIDFRAVDIGNGVKLYTGKFAGMDILFAPNTIANVKAEQSRTQFDIIVPDIKAAKEKAQASGGSVREEKEEAGRIMATLVDPDGNTIVVIQPK